MLQRQDQHKIKRKIHGHRDGGIADRRHRILPRVVAWGQHLDENVAWQPDRECRKRLSGGMRVRRGETAVAEQRGGDWLTAEHPRNRSRQS